MTVIKGGDKLRAELQRIAGEVKSAERVQIGFLEGATYPDGTPVAMIAAIQNWGAPRAGIPPRPFFTDMITEKSPEWGPATAALLKENDYDAMATLSKVGEAVAGQLRESIIKTTTPPLSPITLMIRKMKSEGATITRASLAIAAARLASGESTGGVSTTPLRETGHLLNSVDYVVVKK